MSAAAGPGQDVATLRVGGGAVGFNWLPVIVAERQGMFARRNLAIEIKRLGAVDKATAAVKAGELDLVDHAARRRDPRLRRRRQSADHRRQREPVAALADRQSAHSPDRGAARGAAWHLIAHRRHSALHDGSAAPARSELSGRLRVRRRRRPPGALEGAAGRNNRRSGAAHSVELRRRGCRLQ